MIYKITLIIPTYNSKNKLNRAIQSIIKQSFGFSNIELIIIDDFSTDGTIEILKNFANKYDNIIPVFLEENSGTPSKGRNIGLKKASAEYIMFLDHDDTYDKEMCEKLYSVCLNNDSDMVGCRVNFIDGEKILSVDPVLNDYKNEFFDLDRNFPSKIIFYPSNKSIWNKIYNKKIILKYNIHFPEDGLHEDDYFLVDFYLHAKKIGFLNDFFGYNIYHTTHSTLGRDNLNEKTLEYWSEGVFNVFYLIGNDKNNNIKFKSLKQHMLFGWTLKFLKTDLSKSSQIKFLNMMLPLYKKSGIFIRVYSIPLITNIFLNITIKIFSINKFFPLLTYKLFKLIK
jgi:glycosyltransferase involved in cell wall biosynthesis